MVHILALGTIFFLGANFCQTMKSILGLQPHKGFFLGINDFFEFLA
jgi:hypothetical protein